MAEKELNYKDRRFSSEELSAMDIPELAEGIRQGNRDCMLKMYTLLHDDLFAIAYKSMDDEQQAERVVRKSFTEVYEHPENIDPELFELNIIQIISENVRKQDINNNFTYLFRKEDIEKAWRSQEALDTKTDEAEEVVAAISYDEIASKGSEATLENTKTTVIMTADIQKELERKIAESNAKAGRKAKPHKISKPETKPEVLARTAEKEPVIEEVKEEREKPEAEHTKPSEEKPDVSENTEKIPGLPLSGALRRNKKTAIGVGAVVILFVGSYLTIRHIQEVEKQKRADSLATMQASLSLRLSESDAGETTVVYEYAPEGTIDTHEAVENVHGTLEISLDSIPLNTIGDTEVIYTESDEDDYGQTASKVLNRVYSVQDTQYPVISLNQTEINLSEGAGFEPTALVDSVTDPADGDLVRVDAEPEHLTDDPQKRTYETGWYTVVSDVDTSVTGEYHVMVHAVDNHGNVTDATVTVTVNKKVIPPARTSVNVNSSENAAYIYSYLTGELGLNKAAASGILANIDMESRFNPTAGTSYYGLCQWGGGRVTNLQNFCAGNGLDYTSVEGQIRFMASELSGMSLMSTLQNIENSEEGAAQAGLAFRTQFERAGYIGNVEGMAVGYFNQ